jgi:hypothetical protein
MHAGFFRLLSHQLTTRKELIVNARLDIYKEVHKGLRKALFDLAFQAGSTDFTSADSLQRLKEQFDLTYNLLEVHAHSEDTFVEPLLKQCNVRMAEMLTAAHKELDATVSRLKQSLNDLNAGQADISDQGRSLYLGLTRFISEYLKHIADEEQELMPLLWENFDDEKLMEVTGTIRANVPPAVMANFLSLMIPAMNHGERAELLIGMRQATPSHVFDGVCQLSQRVLSEQDWMRLDETVHAA